MRTRRQPGDVDAHHFLRVGDDRGNVERNDVVLAPCRVGNGENRSLRRQGSRGDRPVAELEILDAGNDVGPIRAGHSENAVITENDGIIGKVAAEPGGIAAGPADKHIVAGTAGKHVIARAALEIVGPALAQNSLAARAADQVVGALGAPNDSGIRAGFDNDRLDFDGFDRDGLDYDGFEPRFGDRFLGRGGGDRFPDRAHIDGSNPLARLHIIAGNRLDDRIALLDRLRGGWSGGPGGRFERGGNGRATGRDPVPHLALQAKIVLVGAGERNRLERRRERVHDLGGRNRRHRRGGDVETRDRGEFARVVQNAHAAGVGQDDLADESVLFLHQHDAHRLALSQLDADLGAADTDGRERSLEAHGVRVGLGDLTADKGEHALHHRHGDRTLLGGGIVDHLVENQLAVLAHREARLVGEDHADRAVGSRFEHVALIDLRADLQLDPGAVRADREHDAVEVLDPPDGRAVGTDDDLPVGRPEGNRPVGARAQASRDDGVAHV